MRLSRQKERVLTLVSISRLGGMQALVATISDGANASLVGISRLSDGTQQLTSDGHALCLFVKHHKPG